MGFFLLIVALVYIAVAFFISRIIGKYTSKRKGSLSFCILLIIPFLRNILVFILFFYYGLFPLSAIHETVEKPISVYWEDNINGGFSGINREHMVRSLLDGKHLKQIVFNGDDGKYYIYTANEKDYKESLKLIAIIKPLKQTRDSLHQQMESIPLRKLGNDPITIKFGKLDDKIFELNKQYEYVKAQEDARVISRVRVVNSKSEIPPVNYSVTLNLLPKGLFVNNQAHIKLIYADRLSIINTKNNKEIAFYIRYVSYRSKLAKLFFDSPLNTGDRLEDDINNFNDILFKYAEFSAYVIYDKYLTIIK